MARGIQGATRFCGVVRLLKDRLMADMLSAMREFRFLEDKRGKGTLTGPEETRWRELKVMLHGSVDVGEPEPEAPPPAAATVDPSAWADSGPRTLEPPPPPQYTVDANTGYAQLFDPAQQAYVWAYFGSDGTLYPFPPDFEPHWAADPSYAAYVQQWYASQGYEVPAPPPPAPVAGAESYQLSTTPEPTARESINPEPVPPASAAAPQAMTPEEPPLLADDAIVEAPLLDDDAIVEAPPEPAASATPQETAPNAATGGWATVEMGRSAPAESAIQWDAPSESAKLPASPVASATPGWIAPSEPSHTQPTVQPRRPTPPAYPSLPQPVEAVDENAADTAAVPPSTPQIDSTPSPEAFSNANDLTRAALTSPPTVEGTAQHEEQRTLIGPQAVEPTPGTATPALAASVQAELPPPLTAAPTVELSQAGQAAEIPAGPTIELTHHELVPEAATASTLEIAHAEQSQPLRGDRDLAAHQAEFRGTPVGSPVELAPAADLVEWQGSAGLSLSESGRIESDSKLELDASTPEEAAASIPIDLGDDDDLPPVEVPILEAAPKPLGSAPARTLSGEFDVDLIVAAPEPSSPPAALPSPPAAPKPTGYSPLAEMSAPRAVAPATVPSAPMSLPPPARSVPAAAPPPEEEIPLAELEEVEPEPLDDIQIETSMPVAPPPAPAKAVPAPTSASLGPVAAAPGAASAGAAKSGKGIVIKGEHRVVVHTIEGLVKRGTLRDADLAAKVLRVELQPGEPPEELLTARVKAIFFMLVAGASRPGQEGRKLRVTFVDGRQVAGFCRTADESEPGFFMVPGDVRTNTARIYIYRAAVRAIAPG